jgi:hypothetical protein
MKTFLLLSFLALPLHAELRAAARGGIFAGAGQIAVGTVELDARLGRWSVAPAYEVLRGGHGQAAAHINVRRLFPSREKTFWIGAGPTFVRSTAGAHENTWNVDGGLEWRSSKTWRPFVAARYYSFHMPIFRDVLEAQGAVLSVGVSRTLLARRNQRD